MGKYVCSVCGYVYDPAVGDPDSGVLPGTSFESLPDDCQADDPANAAASVQHCRALDRAVLHAKGVSSLSLRHVQDVPC